MRWHDRRNGSSSGSALRPVRISDAQLRRNLAKGVSIKTTMEELATYMRGWRGYFGFCQTPEVLIALTRWARLRLRAALWRQWKTSRRRRAVLVANGVSEWAARNTAGGGRGPWYLARSRALSHWAFQCVLQIARSPILVRRVLAQTSRTAVYGPVRTVLWEGRSREAPPYPDQL